jgi:selenium-dependent xanthine dehydrogenase
MEPECAIGFMLGDVVNLYTASQNIFDEQREVGHILGLPPERIHIKSKLVGGGFGGKEDMVVQHHAALATYITKLPVKVKLSRQESINIHPKRHAMTIEMTTACDKNGILTGIKTKIIADTGAYASLGGPVIQRACTHAPGPYQYKSVYIEGTAVYTNNPPAGAFRGFGVTQSNFAAESNLTALAHKVGITPWEIRYRNAIVPGGILPNGQIADKTTAYKECLSRVKEIYDSNKNVGIAGAFKNTGIGVGLRDVGRCIVSVENGNIHIRTGAARIGQGLDTVALQIAAETLELEDVNIVIEPPNTVRTPNSGTTTASRQTLFTGEAITQACLTLKETLKNSTLEALEGQEFYGEYSCKTDPITTEKENPYSHVAYSYGVQLVILNDVGTLKKVHACYDVGQVINPRNVQGQIEGGVVMGLGYALTENYPVKDCIPQVSYGKLGLFRVDKTPEITVDLVEIPYKSELAYGAKGIGEIACIPTAAATSGAYYMLDGEHRTKLPLAHTAYRKQG